jgi:hypothetical protein
VTSPAIDERATSAEARLRTRLESMGARDVSIDWGDLADADTVRLHLIATPRAVLPEVAREALGLGVIDRTVTIRIERPR